MAAFVNDTFTDTAGTALTAHTGETGATWAEHPDQSADDLVITAAGRLRPSAAGAEGTFCFASGTPPGKDYYVEAPVRFVTKPGSGFVGVGVRGGQTGAIDLYWAIFNLGTDDWELWEAGAQRGSSTTPATSAGNTYTLRLRAHGPTVSVWVDGTLVVWHRDAAPAGPGSAFVVGYGAFTDAAGLHLDSVTADRTWTSSVICDGDSMTYGLGVAVGSTYPQQLEGLLGADWAVGDSGANSDTVADMSGDAATEVDAFYDASAYGADNWCVLFGGTNDLYFGASAATTESRIQTYCEDRQAVGFKVVVCTVLPRSDAGTPAGFEADRQAVNTWLRANYESFADALADLAADTRIGDAGDEEDTTYYQADLVHPNATGAGVIAQIVYDAIQGAGAAFDAAEFPYDEAVPPVRRRPAAVSY